jgi:hypothetical protein
MCQHVERLCFFPSLFILCHLLNVGACICHIVRKGQVEWTTPHHTTPFHTIEMLHLVLFHSVTCYTNSTVSCIHVNTTKLHNIICTLVATCVILRSLECTRLSPCCPSLLHPRIYTTSWTNSCVSHMCVYWSCARTYVHKPT